MEFRLFCRKIRCNLPSCRKLQILLKSWSTELIYKHLYPSQLGQSPFAGMQLRKRTDGEDYEEDDFIDDWHGRSNAEIPFARWRGSFRFRPGLWGEKNQEGMEKGAPPLQSFLSLQKLVSSFPGNHSTYCHSFSSSKLNYDLALKS